MEEQKKLKEDGKKKEQNRYDKKNFRD